MRVFLAIASTVFLFISAQAQPQQALVDACTRTVHDYAVHRDALDADAYARVFTEDAVFETPGPTHTGRDALRKYIHSQPANRRTMHHITTVQITPTSDTSATGIVYVTVQFSDRVDTGSAILDRIANAKYYDQYLLEDGVCRIRHRTLEIVMDTKLPDK